MSAEVVAVKVRPVSLIGLSKTVKLCPFALTTNFACVNALKVSVSGAMTEKFKAVSDTLELPLILSIVLTDTSFTSEKVLADTEGVLISTDGNATESVRSRVKSLILQLANSVKAAKIDSNFFIS